MAYAIVRVRGHGDVRENIEDTMRILNLTRPNHCVIMPETDAVRGMLYVAKDYVTWGEVDETMVAKMIKFRGRLSGGKPIDDNVVKEHSKYTSIIALAKALKKGETTLSKLDGFKPIFRLSPPRKGYGQVKHSFQIGGAVGYRGKEINELIERML
ncbi:MAG TPA: 50S ribosomal protein L30 [Methanomassiliicoccales archaeon]|nr:50S ribosomal protein L30 [Methanomassiliicoccales archaeon]